MFSEKLSKLLFIVLFASAPILVSANDLFLPSMENSSSTWQMAMGGDLSVLGSGVDSFFNNPAGFANLNHKYHGLLSFGPKDWSMTLLGIDANLTTSLSQLAGINQSLSILTNALNSLTSSSGNISEAISQILNLNPSMDINKETPLINVQANSTLGIAFNGYHFGIGLFVHAFIHTGVSYKIPTFMNSNLFSASQEDPYAGHLNLLSFSLSDMADAQLYLGYAYPLDIDGWKISIGGSFHPGYVLLVTPYIPSGPTHSYHVKVNINQNAFSSLQDLLNFLSTADPVKLFNNYPMGISLLGGFSLGLDMGIQAKWMKTGLLLSFSALNIGNIPLLGLQDYSYLSSAFYSLDSQLKNNVFYPTNFKITNYKYIIPTDFRIGVGYQVPWDYYHLSSLKNMINFAGYLSLDIPIEDLSMLDLLDMIHIGLDINLFRSLDLTFGYMNKGFTTGISFMLYICSIQFSYGYFTNPLSFDDNTYLNSLSANFSFRF